ncbi:hypothetical protein [Roseibium sp.]|uniref:hypothetical protein n=1 Tax=Roseibium sp. TaxID=1936156 RepID=UPI003A979B82
MLLASVQNSTATEITETHLLSIGICPPWKPHPSSTCTNSINSVGEGLIKRIGIRPENWHKLLNADATTAGLFETLDTLSRELGPTDRLIVHANLHAGSLDPSKPAGPGNDVFVLWSVEKPAVMAFAVAQGLWIQASEFAGRVHKIPAGEVVLILDACESGAVSPLFLNAHSDDDKARPEAVVTSAKADQLANVSADGTSALYSQILGNTLLSETGPFSRTLSVAASRVEASAIPICEKLAGDLKKFGLKPDACNQQPTQHDPDGILSRLQLKAP